MTVKWGVYRLISVIAEEDPTMPSSPLVPFTDAQQIDHPFRYNLFEFVSAN